MSLVAMGLSHHTSPVSVLEEAALDEGGVMALARRIAGGESIREVLVLGTCNRLEVYAEASTFHGAVSDLGAALVAATGIPAERLTDHLYVHYEERAIAHLFAVACGLDSMAVGESSILGQLRAALRRAQRDGRAGPALNGVVQQALRVGKRAHAETELDRASVSLVEAGLSSACAHVGALSNARVVVVGAGSMAGLAVATVDRAGCADLVIASRTMERARRLAAPIGARAVSLTRLDTVLVQADIVISCTGAVGHVLDARRIETVADLRQGRPQAYIDLALPRDIDPRAEGVPGVHLVGLAELGEILSGGIVADDVAEVRDLVTAEVAAYLARRRMVQVAPTVAALRSRATDLLEGELVRLDTRLPDLDERQRAEVRLGMHRLLEKLLHTPTVRVKELAGQSDPGDYAHALRELFGLDPYDVAAVSTSHDPGVLS
ncbi:MAG: glutamyl-tRNA reductase [Dermatophilaceae bacterium]